MKPLITSKIKNNNKKTPNYKSLSFWGWFLLFSFLTATFIYYLNHRQDVEQSLTYFPEDNQVYFKEKHTLLTVKQTEKPELLWRVSSTTNTTTYLRQDVSLLFEDGKLIDIYSKWKKDTDKLSHIQSIPLSKNGHYEALSFHHAEIHYSDDTIKGKDRVTYDHLYVMKDAVKHFNSYQVPVKPAEKKWDDTLDKAQQQTRHYILEQAQKKYNIKLSQYYVFPLTYLHVFDHNSLPGLNIKTTHRAISQLWEGLYREYINGIKLSHTSIESPIGSAMPLVLFSKDSDEFIVLIKTSSGHIKLLKQTI